MMGQKVKVLFYLAQHEHIWDLFCKFCQNIQTKIVSLLPNGSIQATGLNKKLVNTRINHEIL